MVLKITRLSKSFDVHFLGGRFTSFRFFHNKGAVAGVFVVVGLAATAFVIFLLFWCRRRRRTKRLEHDAAVRATLEAHGYGRTFVDGDYDPSPSHISARRSASQSQSQGMSGGRNSTADAGSSIPDNGRRMSTPSMSMAGMASPAAVGYRDNEPVPGSSYNPYNEFAAQNSGPPPAYSHPSTVTTSTSSKGTSGRGYSTGHMPADSTSSSEPLLGKGRESGSTSPTFPPSPPPRNPRRIVDKMMEITRNVSRKGKSAPPSDDFEYDPYLRPILEASDTTIACDNC
jgi:hypothetical protein